MPLLSQTPNIPNVDPIFFDIWFCYGSFSYAIESRFYTYQKYNLILSLESANKEEMIELENFFRTIFDKPKGLMRVELRAYAPPQLLKRLEISEVIYLFTDVVPKLLNSAEDNQPMVEFAGVQGISQSHGDQWLKLIQALI